MTKVKFKMMYSILCLFAFVNGRPYSNGTQLKINFGNHTNFNIPVDTESDTLIVADDEETEEQTNISSKSEMAAIMDAEQNRDEKIVKKTMDASVAILELPRDDVAQFKKQLNISSSMLEEIFDAETGREETLTGIVFRPELELEGEFPRFEFLIGKTTNSSDVKNKTVVAGEEKSNETVAGKKVDFVELVELVKPTKVSENKSAYTLGNITGHYVENDAAPDTSFTDMQTVFVACIGTLLPLLIVLCLFFFIRCLCRRYCKSWCKKSTESSDSESSEDKPENEQLKSSADEVIDAGDGSDEVPPANGSIITMTLKNNHLIVETEERNDITKNGRETKMKYSPDNDGIFVVEVQQSAAYRPISNMQNSPPLDPQISTNQALIHRVPEEEETKATTNYEEHNEETALSNEKTLALSNTGLSISDLSMSSIGSHNASYSYGSQMGYEQGPFGYPVYAGYEIPKEPSIGENITHDNSREPLISRTPTDPDKPIVTAAIFKQDSIIGNDALQGPGYCIEGSSDGPLLSDVQAREVSLQQLHDKMEKKLENGSAILIADKVESPKKALNRADSLPVRIEENSEPQKVEPVIMDVIKEDDMSPTNKDILKGKRASLPIIKTEMYESVKDAIKSGGSPKFEKLTNEQSPSGEPLPMITISEEDVTDKESS